MKLSEIKKRADAKAAEVEASRKHEALIKELNVHPLLKLGCERYVRDAYFCGIVFAAMSDDAKIDDKEQKAITRVGKSLAFSQEEINEFLTIVSGHVKDAIDEGGSDVFALLDESAVAFKDEKVYRLFVAEYVKVCGVKEFDAKDVEHQLQDHIASPLERNINQFVFDPIEDAVAHGAHATPSELLALSEWLGVDETRYFMLDFAGDVGDALEQERKRRDVLNETKKRRAEERRRAEIASKLEAEKVAGFFDAVSDAVEKLGILNDIRTNELMLTKLREELLSRGLGTVDQVKVYQAIHDAFISKIDDASGVNRTRLPNGEVVRVLK